MTAGASDPVDDPWADALQAAWLCAVDPRSLGAALRAPAGPARDAWLAALRAALPPGTPWRRIPLGIADNRLLGGLDLAATLRAGAPVAERGVLAEADGGVVVLAMAERLPAATAGRLALVLDAEAVTLARDGVSRSHPARVGVVALDEGLAGEEQPPAALRDRLAFHLDLTAVPRCPAASPPSIAAARARLARVDVPAAVLEALCGTAAALGVASARAEWFAFAATRAAAALAGRDVAMPQDAALAARLVLAPRATRLPEAAPPNPPPPSPPETPPPDTPPDQQASADAPDVQDLLLAAAQAAIPPGLLARLDGQAGKSRAEGRAGPARTLAARGRPAGVRALAPRGGLRLSVIETLRAAAPWQALRQRDGAPAGRIAIRRDDFRVIQRKQASETTTIFAVDASGSAALHRLAEAKGAVELLLAECYIRRDRVAVLAFRGKTAELLLPPTRSLVRAKRSLAALPGGGGTPLAAGIEAATALAELVRRQGGTPGVVLLTDARANVARDGSPGRGRAEADALAAARSTRAHGVTVVLIDTSPRPGPAAAELARAMGARYLPLPFANAAMLSQAVRAAASTARPAS